MKRYRVTQISYGIRYGGFGTVEAESADEARAIAYRLYQCRPVGVYDGCSWFEIQELSQPVPGRG